MRQAEIAPSAPALELPATPLHEPAGWLDTVDHTKIGILYFWTCFALVLVGRLEALMVRTQLIVPEARVLSAEVYNQMFTMHAVTMVFLSLMPLTTAFFDYVGPLQFGARVLAGCGPAEVETPVWSNNCVEWWRWRWSFNAWTERIQRTVDSLTFP